MHIDFHHARLQRKKLAQKKDTRTYWEHVVDDLVYVSAFVGILANVPQLLKIWHDHSTAGVSVITWGGFLCGSLFWTFYGFVHKAKPIIITNILFAFIQIAIVIGLIIPR